MNYTERMEEALFEQLDDVDCYEDDYSELIETLNNEDSFRSFGEGLLFFLQKRDSKLTAETAAIIIHNKLFADLSSVVLQSVVYKKV